MQQNRPRGLLFRLGLGAARFLLLGLALKLVIPFAFLVAAWLLLPNFAGMLSVAGEQASADGITSGGAGSMIRWFIGLIRQAFSAAVGG